VLLAISRSADGSVDTKTVEHEYLHAQFSEDLRMEGAVGLCFDTLPEARRSAVVELLASLAIYDVTQARLVRNEYFAYALTGDLDGVAGLAGARDELEGCLAAAHITPRRLTRE